MTAINSAVSTSLASILAINASIEALVQEAKDKRKAALEPFLEALAADGSVSIIVVRGYTPGFNDGEPCEHSAEIYVNLKEVTGEEIDESIGLELPEDLIENIQSDSEYQHGRGHVTIPGAYDANVKLAAEHGHVWDKPSSEIMNAINTLIFESAEEEFGTDYWVAYLLEDGKFTRTDGDYDAGY